MDVCIFVANYLIVSVQPAFHSTPLIVIAAQCHTWSVGGVNNWTFDILLWFPPRIALWHWRGTPKTFSSYQTQLGAHPSSKVYIFTRRANWNTNNICQISIFMHMIKCKYERKHELSQLFVALTMRCNWKNVFSVSNVTNWQFPFDFITHVSLCVPVP